MKTIIQKVKKMIQFLCAIRYTQNASNNYRLTPLLLYP